MEQLTRLLYKYEHIMKNTVSQSQINMFIRSYQLNTFYPPITRPYRLHEKGSNRFVVFTIAGQSTSITVTAYKGEKLHINRFPKSLSALTI